MCLIGWESPADSLWPSTPGTGECDPGRSSQSGVSTPQRADQRRLVWRESLTGVRSSRSGLDPPKGQNLLRPRPSWGLDPPEVQNLPRPKPPGVQTLLRPRLSWGLDPPKGSTLLRSRTCWDPEPREAYTLLRPRTSWDPEPPEAQTLLRPRTS